MKKERIIFIIGIITIIISSIISVSAASYLYNSNEVSYNNNSSGIESDNVQGAIDKLYAEATNYNTLSTKVGSDTLNTTSKNLSGAVNELKSNLTTLDTDITALESDKVNYIGLVNVCGSGMRGMFQAIPQKYFGKTVVGAFSCNGQGFFIAYRYGNSGQYGFIMAVRYNNINIYYATVVENNFDIKTMTHSNVGTDPFK